MLLHDRIQTRWQAFALHLAASAVLFVLLAAIIRWFWYPGVLFATEGGWEGMQLIAGVDLVIGPTLTLLVFNRRKPELQRDLAIILLLQAACVVGGMAVVANSRPLAVVYTSNAFYAISRYRFEDRGIDPATVPALRARKPVWLHVELPEDRAERAYLMLRRLVTGGIEMDTGRYRPYAEVLPRLAREGLSVAEAEAAGWQVPAALAGGNVRIHDLQTRYGRYKVAVDTDSGRLLRTVPKAPR